MSTLAEVLGEHVFTLRGRCACGWQMPSQQTLLKSGSSPRKQVSQHLAAVVAEWLTSERVMQVAASHHFCEEYGGCGCCDPELADEFDRELHAKHQLTVLAALAKATCACGEVWGGHPNPHSIVCPAYEKGKTDE